MQDRFTNWLARDPDPESREELEELIANQDHEQLERRFNGRLHFGTAGLRALVGCGPKRMNHLVVRETTTGLGQYLLRVIPDAGKKGVVVGFDGRLHSKRFAQDVVQVLAGLGIRSYLGSRPLPTPLCAFALKRLGAAAGIVVTASHNPPQYNGYKVFWDNGAQIIAPHDQGIAACIEQATHAPIPWLEHDAPALEQWAYPIEESVIDAYYEDLKSLKLAKELAHFTNVPMTIAYTPLHGVGADFVERALTEWGFQQVHTVPEQREPDGHFPTLTFPNPEEPGAMDAVLALAQDVGADLVLANDPDADRLAVAAKRPDGSYQCLNGNEIGILLGDFALRNKPEESIVATSLVSSQMLGRLAHKRQATYLETLTGFKWIANTAIIAENEHPHLHFAMGYEEALGYTIGDLVRDKDGVSAALICALCARSLKAEGKNLFDALDQLRQELGIFVTGQRTLAIDPDDSQPSLGDRLRASPPKTIVGQPIVRRRDLASPEDKSFPQPSDVLIFYLEDNSRVIIRPSGTEPKIKCYYEMQSPYNDNVPDGGLKAANKRLQNLIHTHQQELEQLIQSPASHPVSQH
jgi:phosphomannomutase